MNFAWLKSILPKGLYGRAALILILPIIAIQLVVSVVFIQRLFEDVTRQMTGNVALELAYFEERINSAQNDAQAAEVAVEISRLLGFTVSPLEEAEIRIEDQKSWDDLTGKIVMRTLHETVPEILSVDLASQGNFVNLQVRTDQGPFAIGFSRARVSASNPHQLLVLMLIVSLFMTLISFIFLRNQVRPIRRLARAAEAFGKGRIVPYHITGATEVRQAGQSFIDMRDRIERQIEQRTLMLSGVSHDLRTPLTRLKLALSLSEGDEEAKAMIRDVDDMEKMLEEFLSFARGDSLEKTEQVNPLELTRKLASDMARTGSKIELVLPDTLSHSPLIGIRPMAMQRALENLLTNGLRYGSRCRMTLEIHPEEVVFTVEDDGPGIPEPQRVIALRPFERLDIARNQNQGSGVGLGLAIAMDIASSHGGSLQLSDSDDLGGLKVEMHLPR